MTPARSLLVPAAWLALVPIAAAQPRYHVQLLEGLESDTTITIAGVSDDGAIVAQPIGQSTPSVWRDGAITRLPLPRGAAWSFASAVSNAGVAGVVSGPRGSAAVLWHGPMGRSIQVISASDAQGPNIGGGIAQVQALNNVGKAVGAQFLQIGGRNSWANVPIVWNAGRAAFLSPSVSPIFGRGLGVNDAGVAIFVGCSSSCTPYLAQDGSISVIEVPPIAGGLDIGGINDRGDLLAAGAMGTPWLRIDGQWIRLTSPPVQTSVNGFNNDRTVIGTTLSSGIDDARPLVWRDGGVFDLNGLRANPGVGTLRTAVGINAAGWIVGEAVVDLGPKAGALQRRVYLAIPEVGR